VIAARAARSDLPRTFGTTQRRVGVARTTGVSPDGAETDPTAFVAVTITRIREPMSRLDSIMTWPVRPARGVQLNPAALQATH
jgi:hypothetical protein